MEYFVFLVNYGIFRIRPILSKIIREENVDRYKLEYFSIKVISHKVI